MFELIQRDGEYGGETLFEAEDLEEIAEYSLEKSRGEAVDDVFDWGDE